ncbi:MAG: 16S rRNA (adenine(1518)-N(6)/adenine(1519)-N(6))-dimethyltransferase RsmA [Clostridia bacterium]|nr:16S rRNA (adenine(1518)-N(6)/adenine(1519)-N(6))-dimethyltransferase RsmA [Clostridia bacterium]MBQ5904388.1 16S rRNA (adenine(1518)-N(6)/adenine(1519)-N(6))-dimethyltransferase RsmA [Clostridia bacterium]
MQNLSDISVVRSVLSRHGFNFSKALGQNFLINPTVCPRMAENCGADENTGVIEIGAGIGVLTAELAKRAKKVVSIELDTRLLPVLEETLSDFDNIEVVNADVMKTDLHALIEEKFQGMDVVVCANLPYYITSPIITMLLEEKLPIKAITVMIQKEAADRLSTPVGSRDSGAITVCTNYYAEVKHLFNVSRGSFMPPPNVDSTVIKLEIRPEPAVKVSDEKKFFRMVKAAFAQRRKTAVNSIASGMGLSKNQVAEALQNSGLDVNVRAEKLTMEELAELSENL